MFASMSFQVAAASYDRFMGRYSESCSPPSSLISPGSSSGQRVLDVGCGPGALTGELVQRLGAGAVSAVDPSEGFVAAVRDRHAGVDVKQAAAEHLPFSDGEFDRVLAQLVVHFMKDPVAGLTEMSRVAHRVAWSPPASGITPAAEGHSLRSSTQPVFRSRLRRRVRQGGNAPGPSEELAETAGVRQVEEATLSVALEHATFEEWWEPYTLGVGPAGAYVAGLDSERRAELERVCRESLPPAPFTVTASVWAVKGLA